mgnify:FL=1
MAMKNKIFKILKKNKNFESVFTSKDVDPNNNYEMYELLGDVSANHFIKQYMVRRFKQLHCAGGVKIVARLLINYGSKQKFFQFAENLGFWPFISATCDQRNNQKKKLLEDTFEAFLGMVESTLDDMWVQNKQPTYGCGYNAVYKILKSIFDDIPISLKYEDLYDAKTRLKELFDKFRELGILKYEEDARNPEDKLTTSRIYSVKSDGQVILGHGTAALKQDAQQKAASIAINFLKNRGFVKEIPSEYRELCIDANL